MHLPKQLRARMEAAATAAEQAHRIAAKKAAGAKKVFQPADDGVDKAVAHRGSDGLKHRRKQVPAKSTPAKKATPAKQPANGSPNTAKRVAAQKDIRSRAKSTPVKKAATPQARSARKGTTQRPA